MSAQSRTIGILGGMGPAATVDFMNRVVLATPARDDADHFRMIVDNNPKVPSRIAALIEKTGADPLPELKRMAVGLEKAGADFLVMPCNTAHHFHAAIAEAVAIPFLNIVDVAADHLASEYPEAKRVGFLASPAIQQTRLYHRRFDRDGLTIVYPEDARSARLLTVIRDIKAGKTGEPQIAEYHGAATDLFERADIVLVACTELSILPPPPTDTLPVVDTLDLLVKATIAMASFR
jgi:aspartate racemase